MKLNGITTGRRGDARIAKDRSTDWSRVMTERIDHCAAAVWILKDAQAAQDLSMVGVIAQGAQVHATLALVEQQRIANLLAYAQFDWKGADDGRIFIGREGVMWCVQEAGGRLGVPDD